MSSIEIERSVRLRAPDGVLQIATCQDGGGSVCITALEGSGFFGQKDLVLYAGGPDNKKFAIAVADAIREIANSLPD